MTTATTYSVMTDSQWERLHRLSALDPSRSKIARQSVSEVIHDLDCVLDPLLDPVETTHAMDLSSFHWGRVLDSYVQGVPTQSSYNQWMDQLQQHEQSDGVHVRAIRSMTLQTDASTSTHRSSCATLTPHHNELLHRKAGPSTSAFWDTPGFSSYIPSHPSSSSQLQGVRIGVKDLFAMSGVRCSAGSAMLGEFFPTYTATVVRRLEEHGAHVVGRTAMDAFGMGSWTRTSSWGRCVHPADADRTAGGSSGGSATAVALGLCDVALGSDTGGSVRQPASFCGVVGYKPSYGAFSRYGMVAYAASLDCPGWFAASLPKLMDVLTAPGMALQDPRDMQCVGLTDSPMVSRLQRVAYFPEIFTWVGMSRDVLDAYRATLDRLQSYGCTLVAYPMWDSERWSSVYYAIACAEAHSDLARYQGVYLPSTYWKQHEESELSTKDYVARISGYRSAMFEDEVSQRVLLGAAVLSGERGDALYRAALSRRQAYVQWMQTMMQDVDMLVLPSAPFVAPRWRDIAGMRSSEVYAADRLTVLPSLVGAPAVSMPWARDRHGLPIGMQCVGRVGSDFTLLRQLLALDSDI